MPLFTYVVAVVIRALSLQPARLGDVARSHRVRRAAALAVALAVVLWPAGASASTASVAGGTLFYTASAGEGNDVRVELWDAGTPAAAYHLSDSGATITAGAGCTGVSANEVSCGAPAAATLVLGDRDDILFVSPSGSPVTLALTVDGGAANDALTGGYGADRLDGGSGDDALNGAIGADIAAGGPDNDSINAAACIGSPCPGDGGDTMTGGSGTDTVSYQSRDPNVTVTLDGAANDGTSGEQDNVGVDVENVTGGFGADDITGTDGPNVLDAGNDFNAFDDVLRGAGGDDTLQGGNRLHGGAGDDVLSPGTGVGSVLDGGAGDDLLRRACCSTSAPATITGGTGVDTADYGTLLPDDINAPISVSLDGLANDGAPNSHDNVAADVEDLVGGRGADTLIGDGDDNMLDGGFGTDVLIGGGGTDTADYSSRTSPVTISLDDAANDGQLLQPEIGSNAPENDNVGADVEIVETGSGDDLLVGAAAANRLAAGAGDDMLRGGAGPDRLEGGAGTDTADYSDRTAGVQITADGTPTSGNGDDGVVGARDTVATDVETLVGGAGSDELIGNAAANVIDGADGDDTVSGLAANDLLRGGAGDDVLNGGTGIDTADYSDRSDDVTVVLDGLDGDGDETESDNVGPAQDVEDVDGGSGDDLLVGDAPANELDGAAGDDLLDGAGGADTLRGGDGYDVAAYLDRTEPLSLAIDGAPGSGGALDGPPGARDVIDHDVEGLWGGSASDRLSGSAEDNGLYGGDGADLLIGGGGSDAADYSDRTDGVTVTLDGRAGSGNAADGPAGARDTVSIDVEDIYGGDGNDTLTGNESSNLIDAGAGDDVVNSRDAGEDADLCGDGRDTAIADDNDYVDPSCETIQLPKPTPPGGAPPGGLPPPPPPVAMPDTTPPKATLGLTARQRLPRALKRGLTVQVTCSEACAVDAKLLLAGRRAKALGLTRSGRTVVVAVGHRNTGGAVVLRFTAKARRRLAHVKRIQFTMEVQTTDPTGNRAKLQRKLTLTRKRAAVAVRGRRGAVTFRTQSPGSATDRVANSPVATRRARSAHRG